MEGFSKDGRKLRPRKTAENGAVRSEKVDYQPREERRSFGEHKSYGDRPARPYGDRPARTYGDRPARPYGDRSERPDGERRSFGERKSYGDRPARPYSDRPARPYGDRSARPYGDRPQGGKKFGPKKPFGRKPAAPTFGKAADEGISRMISRRPQIDADNYSGDSFNAPVIQNEIRLNRFIANSGVCSRREADTLIQAGVVTVNGEVVTELGTKVNIFEDDVRFNGERLKGEEKVYIVMNKPRGFVTTASDPHAEKTVLDLLKNCSTRVYPVGRLDKATTGVLMFTNDGEIAERLTHPSYDKKKIYQVAIDRNLSQEDYDTILSGVALTDGEVKADALEFIDEEDHRKLGIEIHSGKNRVVRRIFETLGYNVKALDRVYFAGLTKKGLKKGEWRYLNESEVNILKMGAYI